MNNKILNQSIADEIKKAFLEGYCSYVTACCADNTEEMAWAESETKKIYDKLISENPL